MVIFASGLECRNKEANNKFLEAPNQNKEAKKSFLEAPNLGGERQNKRLKSQMPNNMNIM